MKVIPSVIAYFLKRQHFVAVTTMDKNGFPHNSCKGLVKIKGDEIFLLDLYKTHTYNNLRQCKKVGVTAIDASSFKGYTIKGYAKIVSIKKAHNELLSLWEENIMRRMSHRVLSHVKKDLPSKYHPEVLLPHPQYIIVVKAKKIIDLVPQLIKE